MNKFKEGNLVQIKSRVVRRYVKNLALIYTKPGTQEFATQYASELLMFLSSFLKLDVNPVGKVIGYGARSEDKETRYLILNIKNKFGKAEVVIVSEDEVVKIKKIKRK